MSDFNPNFDQSHAYFSKRLAGERIAKANTVSCRCPFHGDKTPSLSLNLGKGVWKCHTCNQGGGIFDFERRMFPSDSVETAWANIYRICGMELPPRHDSTRKLTATYDYADEIGVLQYQKLRYELPDGKKSFAQRQPNSAGGWRYNLEGVKKVLYRLPGVVTAQFVIVCEGEKDVDNLTEALKPYLAAHPETRVAATTNFDGAGKWLPHYSPYMTGKHVIILPDNDANGKIHGQLVAAAVVTYAAKVKVVELPGLPEKGDVSDWLEAGNTIDGFFNLVKATGLWKEEEKSHRLLIEAGDFLDIAPQQMEWLVEGMIPAKCNGLILAHPKAGKSLITFDLALALVSGSAFLGFPVPHRRRVALISREDSPDESSRRLSMLRAGDPARTEYQWGQLWINTRYQSEQFLLDNAADVDELIRELKMEQMDLAIFDVYRRMHQQDENDNTAMSLVTDALVRIQNEAGCAVMVVHHLKKEEGANIFRGQRGAGVSHGWTEWGVGITVVDESLPRKDWVRKVEFEVKYACPPDPVYFMLSGKMEQELRVDLVEAPDKNGATRQVKTHAILGTPAVRNYYDRDS